MGSRADIERFRSDSPQYVFEGCDDESEYQGKVVRLVYDQLHESRQKWRDLKKRWHSAVRRLEMMDEAAGKQSVDSTDLPILPQAIEEQVALMVEALPRPEPKARTSEHERIVGALSYFMEQELDANDFTKVMGKAILNQKQMFLGIVKVLFDKDLPGQYGQDGRIVLRTVDSRYFWPDPLAKGDRFEDSRYWIFAEPEDLASIRQRFPQTGHRVRAESEYCLSRGEDGELDTSGDYTIGKRERALVIECWLRDDRKHFVPDVDEDGNEVLDDKGEAIGQWKKRYPHGRLIIVANNVLLFDGPNPFDHGRPPYALFPARISNQVLSWSDVELLIRIEDKINKLHKEMLKNARVNMNSPWITDNNAFKEPRKFRLLTNEPGLVIPKTPGSEVTRMPPAELPQFIFPLISWLRGVFDDVLGVQAVLRGQLEKGAQLSADAVDKLQVSSTSRIRWKQRLMETGIKDLGHLLAWSIRQFYPSNLEVTVNDPRSGEQKVYHWNEQVQKADYSIQIQPGSGLPGAKDSGFQLYLKMWQLNLISRLRTLKALNVPDAESVDAEMKEEEKRLALLGQLGKPRGNKSGSAGRKDLGGVA